MCWYHAAETNVRYTFPNTFLGLSKIKPWVIVHGFLLRQLRIPSKRASLEEQNGASFRFIAFSSQELQVHVQYLLCNEPLVAYQGGRRKAAG